MIQAWALKASKKMCVVLRATDPTPAGWVGRGGGKMMFGSKAVDGEGQEVEGQGMGMFQQGGASTASNDG